MHLAELFVSGDEVIKYAFYWAYYVRMEDRVYALTAW